MVGWALATNHIDAAHTMARANGFDPGGVVEGHRVAPSGRLMRWRLTNNALTAGPVLFLISWGETPHPATSAPSSLELESLPIEHPDPASIQPALGALGADMHVHPAPAVALVLRVRGPRADGELR